MASLLALLLFLLMIQLLTLLLSRRRHPPQLRPISAFDALPSQIGRATESGQKLHISLGTGGIGSSDTVTSWVGLSVLGQLVEQGVATNTPPLVTVSDPTLLPVAQNVLRRVYTRRGRSRDFRWTQVRLVSPAPMAYALGTMNILNQEAVLANVMVGSFGPEIGLMTHAGAEANLAQIGGTDNPQSLAILLANTDLVAIGEELYAAESYLDRTPVKLASLAAEDVARIVIILFVIVSASLRIWGVL